MARPDRWFDWHRAVVQDRSPAPAADPRRRIRGLGLGVGVCFALVFVRCVALEYCEGAAFREVAAKVWSEASHKPAPRGRILSRHGTPLAEDATRLAVTVPYRYLQQRSDPRWLRRLARRRRRSENEVPHESLATTMNRLRVEHAEMHRQLASLARVSQEEWLARCRQIEIRVQRMADHVNRHRRKSHAERQLAVDTEIDDTWTGLFTSSLLRMFAPPDDLPPPRITIREEVDRHTLAVGLSVAAATEIEQHPDRFPGVRVERTAARSYPRGNTAAHLIGYLAVPNASEIEKQKRDAGERSDSSNSGQSAARVGRTGIERAREKQLRGVTGIDIQKRDAAGQLLTTHAARSVIAGQDVRLTIDLPLQSAAEQLLDQVQRQRQAPLVRSRANPTAPNHGGGSIVVMNIQSGELLTCASAPRFDPNVFTAGQRLSNSDDLRSLFSDPNRALFHRATQMALPPGSVFKPLVAVAMLESGEGVDPDAPFVCRGYLRQPNSQRCYIFRRYGVGHGPLAMRDALAMSCNVYFYHHAGSLGPQALVGWASRFGFGQATGLDALGDAKGNLSSPRSMRERHQRAWQLADTEAFAIGQGALTVTPLQIVRMMTAIANGGRLVTPRLIALEGNGGEGETSHVGRQLSLRDETLKTVRAGLRRAAEDPDGTAYRAFSGSPVSVAGKTGTAEAGGGQEDHAWFAGYAPAENPQVAFVVALEHAGSGGEMAAPVARRLVGQMHRLGYFKPSDVAERRHESQMR